MSTQAANSVELANTNQNIQPQSPQLILVKDGPFKGRQVALIPLDNPAALNSKIARNKLLADKESIKASLCIAAGVIVVIVLLTLVIVGSIFSLGIVWIPGHLQSRVKI